MIARMAQDLEDMLRARGFPLRIAYGPEAHRRNTHDSGIVIERDRTGGDGTLREVIGNGRNPQKFRVRDLGCVATIYAQSSLAGARIQDHEHLCDDFVDALIIALQEWGTMAKAGNVPVTQAGYVAAAEFADVETWPGVVYRMRFQVSRAVAKRTYEGAARPTGAVTGVTNRTDVRREGAPDSDTPDVGCGA